MLKETTETSLMGSNSRLTDYVLDALSTAPRSLSWMNGVCFCLMKQFSTNVESGVFKLAVTWNENSSVFILS